MFDEIYRTEKEFRDKCPCYYAILEFIDNIKDTDVRWFFDVGYAFYPEKRYCIIFKSYITPEYEDYVLSVESTKVNDTYNIKIVKKVDNLLCDNA